MTTGERLMKLRKDRHISVSELANRFNCSRQYIHSLEKSSYPLSRSMLEKYCQYFKTSADFIMGMEDRNSTIPVFQIDENEMNEESSMSIPPRFLKKDKEYFAISLGNKRLVILERDGNLRFECQGMFRYRDSYYFSRLEKFSDGSVWLISENRRKPERIEKMDELTSIGYQSYQLT